MADTGDAYYDVVVLYENPTGWTQDSITLIGETPEELIDALTSMLQDMDKYPILNDTTDGQ